MTLQLVKFLDTEFRWFHSHPELSLQEFATTLRLKADLSEAGVRLLPLDLKTGVVAEVGSGERVVALRADIDALPLQEETTLEYQSATAGVMHACGHDFHAAVILGTALLLKDAEARLPGRVRLIFQPAEELPGGARLIIKAGALKQVSAIFGIHTIINYPVGTLVIREGPTHAAVDRFSIVFKGKGTHAAHPEEGIDPIVAASDFVSAAQSVVSRSSSPFANNLLSITRFDAGTTWNVIPEKAVLEGTIRTLNVKQRSLVRGRMSELAEHTALAYGARAEVRWISGLPAAHNTPELAQFAAEVAKQEGYMVDPGQPSLGGEDFALYEEVLPGAFIQIGAGESPPAHSPGFRVDPAAIYPAAAYMAHLARSWLERGEK